MNILLLFAFLLLGLTQKTKENVLPEATIPLRVLREDENGIEILYQNETEKDQSGYPLKIASGRKIGEYPLPVVEILIGVPQEGEISLSASSEEKTYWEKELTYDPDGYPIPETIPERPLAEISAIEFLRDVRFARIHLFPVKKEGKGFLVSNRVKIKVKYHKAPKIVERKDYFDDIYEWTLLNGKKAKFYKVANEELKIKESFFKSSLHWVKIKIDSTGIYKISGRDLKKIGLALPPIDPKTLKVYHIGKFITNSFYPDTMIELPIYVKGEEDGKFDEEDFLLFYGEFLPSLYTNFNSYWLTFGVGEGRRMEKYLASPFSESPTLTTGERELRWEKDLVCPARSGLLWLWEYFSKAKNETRSYSKRVFLPQAKRLKKIKIAFCPLSDSCQVQVSLNGHLLDSITLARYPPPQPFIYEKDTSLVISEDNSLDFLLYGEKEAEFYLDWLAFTYEKDLTPIKKTNLLEFTVKEPGNYNVLVSGVKNPSYLFEVLPDTSCGLPKIKRLEEFACRGDTLLFNKTFSVEANFLVLNEKGFRTPLSLSLPPPVRLRQKNFAIDYLIITPDEFRRPARLLAQYRKNNIADLPQAQTEVATLSEIYNEYSFGIEEPGAIKKFLKEKRPYYVTLIGDATYDYRGLLPYKKPPGVPTYEYGYDFSPNPYTDRAYACDAWYADLEGSGWSPDLILSRLPVRSERELEIIIKKIINFEKAKEIDYRSCFLLAGDDEFNGYYDRRDNIRFGTHIEQCEGLSLMFGTNFEAVKVYLTEYPYPLPNDKPQAREALLSALNKGVGLMAYFGHGWVGWLTHEKLLDLPSLKRLNNKEKLFFGFYGSCGVGKFDESEQECLAEELQRKEGGAIATVAASKATISSTNYLFAQSLFLPLTSFSSSIIGKGFLNAWLLERKYHLFGDGATSIRLVKSRGGLSLSPCTLKPGNLFTLMTDSSVGDGYYQITVYTPQLYRHYISYGEMNYTLPGEIAFQGKGKIEKGRPVSCQFLFPKLTYPEVRYVTNGSYTILPNSAKIRVLLTTSDTSLYYVQDGIPFINAEIISSDTTGPEISLHYQGKRIIDSAWVEPKFILNGSLYDESGVNLLAQPYPPGFYLNEPSLWYDLRPNLSFAFSSYKSANFSYPLQINEPCSVVFIVRDNIGNQTKKRFYFHPISESSLAVENCLYVQSGSSGYFTFHLSNPAFVKIKVYTISGRFLKEVSSFAGFGFNQVYFDGCDRKGKKLPKGVYLYRIEAETIKKQKAEIFDKFFIR